MSGLLCGAAKACITPPAEMIPGLYGLMNKRFASVHDDLYLRVIAFGNGEEKALVVGFDLDKAPRPEENLKALTEVTGIPEERILYFGIHTHTAPLTGPRPPFEQPKDEFTAATTARYEAMIAGKLLGAAKEAIASMREVRLGVAEGMSYINVNRNQVFEYEEPETGKIYRYLGLGANFEGPVDHFVRTLKAEDPDGKTVALLVNYACHNVVMIGNDADGQGNVAIGGDVGGNVSRMLEEKYGGDAVWSSGPAGDVNPIMMNQYYSPNPMTGASEEYFVKGDEAAKAQLEVLKNRHMNDIVRSLRTVKCKAPSGDETVPIRGIVEWIEVPSKPLPAVSEEEKRRMAAHGMASGPYRIRMQALRIGELVLIGAGGELFTRLGWAIRDTALEAEGIKQVMVLNHNVSLLKDAGYIADDETSEVVSPDCPVRAHVPGGNPRSQKGTIKPALISCTAKMMHELKERAK